MRALSVRQPYAELILRGVKTVELRSVATRIVGERFYLYAAKARAKRLPVLWSADLGVGAPPGWMVELARQVGMIPAGERAGLPTGVIVGSAVIAGVDDIGGGMYGWRLTGVRRAKVLSKPKGHPQPVWFEPF